MKGYYTQYGYMGYVTELEKYILFASETDYLEYL